ncbi:class I ribonucleotide reductase maintenance protein YfaE [Oceanisphaera sp. IT1-181]|uniref:class I ribonucleotide reductase maintenance protein YfaE n=1 Tax=Oceanisphaera sp. IT1-181 TaxID=3081199 RepID=UPI0029C9CEE5|nr:class I ribonucleotide reductase maintenance protein YfaE [Oceanisphaera sp. IT1-181]
MSRVTTQALSFELRAGESLLAGLERTGHAVEYQCRGGYCGSCRTTLISGEVSYQSTPLAFIAAGEVLPCCARPEGEVVLDIDAEAIKKQA